MTLCRDIWLLGGIRGWLRPNLTCIIILLRAVRVWKGYFLLCYSCIPCKSKLFIVRFIRGGLVSRIFIVESLEVIEQDWNFDLFLFFRLFFFWWVLGWDCRLVDWSWLCRRLSVAWTRLMIFAVKWVIGVACVHSAWSHYLLVVCDVVLVILRSVLVGA